MILLAVGDASSQWHRVLALRGNTVNEGSKQEPTQLMDTGGANAEGSVQSCCAALIYCSRMCDAVGRHCGCFFLFFFRGLLFESLFFAESVSCWAWRQDKLAASPSGLVRSAEQSLCEWPMSVHSGPPFARSGVCYWWTSHLIGFGRQWCAAYCRLSDDSGGFAFIRCQVMCNAGVSLP
mmetsp:Transcript_27037/g.57607  ORF Transcript_27037/g.57607 Transcript_27037/m.57607 type:complete len:179 (+) Transcript_27037:1355-1891(+)